MRSNSPFSAGQISVTKGIVFHSKPFSRCPLARGGTKLPIPVRKSNERSNFVHSVRMLNLMTSGHFISSQILSPESNCSNKEMCHQEIIRTVAWSLIIETLCEQSQHRKNRGRESVRLQHPSQWLGQNVIAPHSEFSADDFPSFQNLPFLTRIIFSPLVLGHGYFYRAASNHRCDCSRDMLRWERW
jgi:hypothetical protein